VRNRARDLGVDLTFVPGSGPAGRITHEDLDGFHRARRRNPRRRRPAAARPLRSAEGTTEVKIIGLRRKIAEKMAESVRRIPHITYVEEIDMTALEELRAHLNATKAKDQPKLNVLPFIARAIVVALRDQPQINATYDDEAGVLTQHAPVHLGIAAQTPNGLMVPVVRHAEARDPMIRRWRSPASRARPRTVRPSAKNCRARPSPSPRWARWAGWSTPRSSTTPRSPSSVPTRSPNGSWSATARWWCAR
jgi:2-oxoisovalerate dehydrogenase E2 component (dihydrolipoyl transacylase)